MEKITFSRVRVSDGYNGAEAIDVRQTTSGQSVVSFNVGFVKYNPETKKRDRWANIKCQAFGSTAERIINMKLGAGSTVSLSGDFDIQSYEKDGQKKHIPIVTVEDLEYVPISKSGSESDSNTAKATTPSGGYEAVDGDEFDEIL